MYEIQMSTEVKRFLDWLWVCYPSLFDDSMNPVSTADVIRFCLYGGFVGSDRRGILKSLDPKIVRDKMRGTEIEVVLLYFMTDPQIIIPQLEEWINEKRAEG